MDTFYLIVLITNIFSLIFFQSRSTSDEEFNWEDLINWSNSFEEGKGTSMHSGVHHTNPNPILEKSQQIERETKDKHDHKKLQHRKTQKLHYHNVIKKDENKLNRNRKSQKAYYDRKKGFLASLPLNEREEIRLKERKKSRESYHSSNKKRGNKTTYRVLLDLIKENKATEEQKELIERKRANSRANMKKSRLKKTAEKR